MVNGMVSLAFGLFLFLRRGGLRPPVAGSFSLLGGGGYHPPVCPKSAIRPVGRSRRGGTTTEPPRDGQTLGAIALVGVQDHSINTERQHPQGVRRIRKAAKPPTAAQRAARGIVSCPLPAPDGDTPPLDGSPVEEMGVRGRRDRALSNARKPPPAVFWFLLHRCKRNSPAGEILNVPLLFPVKRAGG